MGHFTLGTTTTGGGGGGTCTGGGLTGAGLGLLTSGAGGVVLTLPVQMLMWLTYACCVIMLVTSHLGHVILLKVSAGGTAASVGFCPQMHSIQSAPHTSHGASSAGGVTSDLRV